MSEYKNKIRLWECYKGQYPISQKFGEHFYNQQNQCVYKNMGLEGHNGIDFALPIGTNLWAVNDGLVYIAVEGKDGYGNYVRLHCRENDVYYEVTYGHCSKLSVKQGEKVKKGQIIAQSGNSGFSSGPHLHFGLRVLDDGGKVLNYDNGYKGSIDSLPLFDLSAENAPKNEENKLLFEETPRVESNEYWEWFCRQKFIDNIDKTQNIQADTLAKILFKLKG
ncbi:MAG: M23 family metallopeptidase [bacterium]